MLRELVSVPLFLLHGYALVNGLWIFHSLYFDSEAEGLATPLHKVGAVLVTQLGVLLEVSPRLLSYTDVHVNATPSVRRTASAPIVSAGILVMPERYRLVIIGRMSPQAARYLELGCRLGASAIILR